MIAFLSNKVNMISCEEKVSLLGKTPVIEIEHICQNDNDNLMFASSKMQKKKNFYLKLPILKLARKMCETWLLKSGKEAATGCKHCPFSPAEWCHFAFF